MDPFHVFLSASPSLSSSPLLFLASIWPFIIFQPCNLPSRLSSPSLGPTAASIFFLPPSLSPSLCSLSPMIPGSVSASRLSALKLSQRRLVAGRNPVLRGNYLPHRLPQHTQAFTVQLNLPILHANSTHELIHWCFSVLHGNLQRLPLSSFVRWHLLFFLLLARSPAPSYWASVMNFLWMFACASVCGGPSAASIAISAAAGVIVPQWLQCRRGKKKKHIIW